MVRGLAGVAAAAMMLCGCVTLGGDPVMQSMQPVTITAPCATVPSPTTRTPRPSLSGSQLDSAVTTPAPNTSARDDLSTLCGAVRRAAATGSSYIYFGRRLDQAQATLGMAQIASVTALVGFDRFDAHEDNISAATIIGALATGMRSGLRPQARRDITRLGASAMNCVAVEGSDFLLPLQRSESLQTKMNQAAGAAIFARLRLTSLRNNAGIDSTRVEDLEAALAGIDSAIQGAADAVGNRRAAAARVNGAHRTIETRLTELLSQQVPDFDAVARLIRENGGSPAPVQPTPPAEGERAVEMKGFRAAGVSDNTQLQLLADALRALTAELARESSGPSQADLDEIAACANLN